MKNQKRSIPHFFKAFLFFFSGTLLLISLFFIKNPLTPLFTALTWGFILSYLISIVFSIISLFKDTLYRKLGSLLILILVAAVTLSFYIKYMQILSYSKILIAY